MNEIEYFQLSSLDYVIFISLLLVSILVGIYYAWKEKQSAKKQSADSFMLNNDDMNPYAAGMSIFVSMLSALTIIGWPTEVFLYGDAIVWRLAGGLLAAWMGTSVFVPFFHRLRLFSIYDYFKLRFNSPFMMNVTLAIGLIALLWHMMSLSYLTALSLSTLVKIPVLPSLLLLNTIAIMYTLLGGMKAVIMTDLFQSFVMLASMMILVACVYAQMGAKSIIAIAAGANGHRMTDLSFDLTRPGSAWGYVAYEFCIILRVTFGQFYIQRVVACKTEADGKKSFMIGCGFAWVVGVVLIPLLGVATLAYFRHCDPLQAGIIEKKDQIVPLLTTKVFETKPGLVGLYISAAYSATLSTISTGLNSIATVFFKSVFKYSKELEAGAAIRQQRIFMALLGYLIVLLAYLMSFMPSTVISIANMVSLGSGCIVASAFFHSILIPKMNIKGLLAGYVSAMLPIIISLIGIFKFPRPDDRSNETVRDITECSAMFEEFTNASVKSPLPTTSSLDLPTWYQVFWISPLFTATFCFIFFSIVAIPVSFATHDANKFKPNPDHHIFLFQSSLWPKALRNLNPHPSKLHYASSNMKLLGESSAESSG